MKGKREICTKGSFTRQCTTYIQHLIILYLLLLTKSDGSEQRISTVVLIDWDTCSEIREKKTHNSWKMLLKYAYLTILTIKLLSAMKIYSLLPHNQFHLTGFTYIRFVLAEKKRHLKSLLSFDLWQ